MGIELVPDHELLFNLEFRISTDPVPLEPLKAHPRNTPHTWQLGRFESEPEIVARFTFVVAATSFMVTPDRFRETCRRYGSPESESGTRKRDQLGAAFTFYLTRISLVFRIFCDSYWQLLTIISPPINHISFY
jgi:hypothetical protein